MISILQVPRASYLVYIPTWEYECCGDPVTVGGTIELDVRVDQDGPGSVVDAWSDLTARPILAGSHHGPERNWTVRAVVERLWEARVHHERGPDGMSRRVPGSGELAQIGRMQVWEADWLPAARGGVAAGWVLQIQITDVLESYDGSPLPSREV